MATLKNGILSVSDVSAYSCFSGSIRFLDDDGTHIALSREVCACIVSAMAVEYNRSVGDPVSSTRCTIKQLLEFLEPKRNSKNNS